MFHGAGWRSVTGRNQNKTGCSGFLESNSLQWFVNFLVFWPLFVDHLVVGRKTMGGHGGSTNRVPVSNWRPFKTAQPVTTQRNTPTGSPTSHHTTTPHHTATTTTTTTTTTNTPNTTSHHNATQHNTCPIAFPRLKIGQRSTFEYHNHMFVFVFFKAPIYSSVCFSVPSKQLQKRALAAEAHKTKSFVCGNRFSTSP